MELQPSDPWSAAPVGSLLGWSVAGQCWSGHGSMRRLGLVQLCPGDSYCSLQALSTWAVRLFILFVVFGCWAEMKCKEQEAMEKLGMKAVTGVSRVTIKQSKTATFVLSKRDVFKSSHLETYVMFGVVKMEDMNTQLMQTQAAEQFKAPGPNIVISKGEPSVSSAQHNEEVEETCVDKKDVELVMAQASVSRSRAVKALKAADGDIVSAIMKLTN
ncbi:nascent polypeptide-associated complex subunit alpha-like protein 1 [Triticum dicoccoides]|uniref:nascent polypeptide-associated complex subunit alpha-like protein 1 n=1 Tax=Triticum dicoccoides TaxID=85692 RepID=UPI001890A0C6|nr:nascent polypeptide-associated complex subunit alpha-like protein 1 [Triticum dicoccoides]